MTKRKILYHFSGHGVLTGSPRALLTMIDSLDRGRFLPAFIGTGSGTLVEELRSRNVELIESEVASISWNAPLDALSRIREKHRLLRRMEVDIVHMNEPGWNSDLVMAAYLNRTPVALHLHNPGVVCSRNLNYAIARRIFFCSRAQALEVGNFEKVESKSTILHNAVDIKFFANGHSIRDEIGLQADDIVIGTVAQIGYRKGIDLFLDAAQHLLDEGKSIKFVIAGPQAVREEEYFKTIMDRLQHGQLKGNVLYLGSRTDIPDVLSSLDIFFLPTRAEPFGMVVIEAMAAGLPVVASEVGGIPEIIISADIGRTVRSLTPDAFAAAIDTLIGMGEGRRALGKRARQSLNGRFDLASMGQTLMAVYEELKP